MNIENNDQGGNTEYAQSRYVSPLRGFYWIEKSLSDIVVPHFGKWFVAGLAYIALALLAQLAHQNLALIINFLGPIFISGGLIGAHLIKEKNQAPKPWQFFVGFMHPSKIQMLILIAVQVAISAMFVYFLIQQVGVELITSIDLERLQSQEEQAYAQQIMTQLLPVMKWVILFAFFYLLLNWFVISLITLNSSNAIVALKESLIGSIKNIGAILLFIIISLIIMIVLGIILSLVLAAFASILPKFVLALISLSLMAIVMPVVSGVLYISYREVFFGETGDSEKSI